MNFCGPISGFMLPKNILLERGWDIEFVIESTSKAVNLGDQTISITGFVTFRRNSPTSCEIRGVDR